MQKLYAHAKAEIAANQATASERRAWNDRIDRNRSERDKANRNTFIPRKASHKQGWKRPEVQPF